MIPAAGRWARSPKALMLLALLPLIGLGATRDGPARVVVQLAVAVVAAVGVDLGMARVRQEGRFPWDGAVICGLLVGMVLAPLTPPGVAAIAGGLAALSKHMLRAGSTHVFNPSAVGLLAAGLAFPGSGQSWWGALGDLPAPFILLVLAGGTLIAFRVNRMPSVLAFLLVFFAALTLVAAWGGGGIHLALAFRAPFSNAAVFFACFMLTDPRTSPTRPADQASYGATTGVASLLAFFFLSGFGYLLVGLLAGNAWQALRRGMGPRPAARIVEPAPGPLAR
ncbi:MAG TPA: RnfABCDGE type electron transport complex subunit D [Candidatus Limnocylindrales bacterium]|nr:RnfABCDGE type electron transport complex subunit D [Candidatus Limnocylindrales bacterium]